MTNTEITADMLFSEGKQYNWRQGESPAAATLARAAFQRAAAMGHAGAIRALAHMTFDGHGGGQDREQALLMLSSACFAQADRSVLEELVDMLGSYAETAEDTYISKTAAETAAHVEELSNRLGRVQAYMQALAQEWLSRNKGGEEA